MDHQPDVQEQQSQHHHHHQQQPLQNHQNSANIVYIQQNLPDYQNRNQNPSTFVNENEGNLIRGTQTFQQQNANFGQFENHYTYLGNGNFSPSNPPPALIPGFYNKTKHVSVSFRRTQFVDQDGSKFHQFPGGNYASTDLQRITYQQQPFFLTQNVGNQFPLSDMLVPTCQSSGSSEASDDSSISNISQPNYSNDSSAFPNAHLEFTAPIPVNGQNSRSYNHFQQKEYPENYMSVIQPENQIPRCDSSKSETTESTCSSLSSGSAESQSEENPVRLPVLVNPVINNNATSNIYESNTQTSINTYSHHSQINEDQQSYQGVYTNAENSGIDNNFSKVNPVISDQKNNLVVVFPNRIGNQNSKQTQPEPSKFNRTQQRVQQQKIFGLINIQNQASRDKIAVPVQMIKLNNGSSVTSTLNSNNILDPNARYIKTKSHNTYNAKNDSNNGNIPCATSNNFIGDNQTVMQNVKNSDSNNESGNDKNDENAGGDEDINEGSSGTSQIQNTSESSVINSNYKLSTNVLDCKENDCAMLMKETSDKCISQCSSDVNSSMLNSNSVYLVNSNQSDLIKNNCFGDSSVNSCLNPGSSTGNILPVPNGWRRLLMDGSIVYLR